MACKPSNAPDAVGCALADSAGGAQRLHQRQQPPGDAQQVPQQYGIVHVAQAVVTAQRVHLCCTVYSLLVHLTMQCNY